MLDKMLRMTGTAALYMFASLFLAQIVLFTSLAFLWNIDKAKRVRMLAIAQGYDVLAAQRQINEAVEERVAKMTYDEVLELRAKRLREEEFDGTKIGKGADLVLAEGRDIEAKLKTLQTHAANFERRLDELLKKEKEEGLLLETQMIEKLPAEMGKRVILKILKDTNGLERVILLLKGMEVNARRKILAEMEQEDELDDLVKVLQKIGDGYPVSQLIDEARKTIP